MKHKHALLAALLLSPTIVAAEPVRSTFYTNDFIGDGYDRWRSASYTTFWGFDGERTGGYAYDVRLRGEIISPWSSEKQADDDDRPYAGMIGLGAFLNERFGLTDLTAGGEVLIMGDQTGIHSFQNTFHDILGLDGYMPEEEDHLHLEDTMTGMLTGEVAMNYFVGQQGALRPYVAAQYGYETYLRAGIDYVWGNYSFAEQYVRDPVSGFIQPSSAARADAMEGFSFIAGADYTAVTGSEFFPDDATVEVEPGRLRARLGAQAKIGPASVFYGLTHLTKEFQTQEEGQTVGTFSIEFPF